MRYRVSFQCVLQNYLSSDDKLSTIVHSLRNSVVLGIQNYEDSAWVNMLLFLLDKSFDYSSINKIGFTIGYELYVQNIIKTPIIGYRILHHSP